MTTEAVFHSILVPVDGSLLAESALPLAARLAHAAGASLRLVLVHALPPAPPDPASVALFTPVEVAGRRAERGYLEALESSLRETGTRVASVATLTGPVGPTLVEYVGDNAVDLVVMATHGRGGVRRAWLGSVADYLMRHLQGPVILIRPPEAGAVEPSPARGILVPLDGSRLAESVLHSAAAVAQVLGAELTLCRVVPPVLEYADLAMPMAAPADPDLTERCRLAAQADLNGVVAELRAGGIVATGTAVVGHSVAETIQELARPGRFGLIALATHGRGGVRRLALGSVADKLVRSAEVPVLVYRPTGVGDIPQPRLRRRRAAAGG